MYFVDARVQCSVDNSALGNFVNVVSWRGVQQGCRLCSQRGLLLLLGERMPFEVPPRKRAQNGHTSALLAFLDSVSDSRFRFTDPRVHFRRVAADGELQSLKHQSKEEA
eukprot:1652136-Amphidinium_carterae.2